MSPCGCWRSRLFCSYYGKEVFGGTGMNILNPALTARAFLFLLIQVKWEPSLINTSTDKGQAVVAYSGATPLGDAAAGFADKIPSIWNHL
jgi:Na+-transporting NADH:ubiquinone oxidoreductase subunit B